MKLKFDFLRFNNFNRRQSLRGSYCQPRILITVRLAERHPTRVPSSVVGLIFLNFFLFASRLTSSTTLPFIFSSWTRRRAALAYGRISTLSLYAGERLGVVKIYICRAAYESSKGKNKQTNSALI